MKRLKKENKLPSIIFLLIISLLLLVLAPIAYSRYESNGQSNVNASVAYYVLEPGYQYLDVRIPNMVPRVAPYVYNFSIANNKGGKRSEVSLEYDLMVKTTTNLELRYELYMNEDYTSSSAQNILVDNQVKADQYGTYFREMKAPTQYFNYRYNEQNNYTLLIYFDERFKNYKYQNIIESIFIVIDSKQTIS